MSSLLAEPAAVAMPAPRELRSARGRALVPVLLFLGMVVSVISSLGAPLIPTIATDYYDHAQEQRSPRAPRSGP